MRIKIFGVGINVSFLSILLVSFGIVTSVSGQRLILYSLISAVVHEIGHIIFISILKERPRSVDIGLYEFKINCDLSGCGFKEDVLITSAGVMFNCITSLMLWIVNIPFEAQWIKELCLCGVCVGFINLLPLESFDGGQLLSLILSRFFKEKTVNFILTAVTVILFFPIMLSGIFLLFATKFNYSLLFVAIYLLIISVSKYI